MDPYQAVQAIAGMFYLVTITAVAIRLLVLARRNRGVPELLIGASLLVGGTFGSMLEAAAMSGELSSIEGAQGTTLALGKILGNSGFALQALFIRSVFRPNERWATGLVGVILTFQVGTWTAYWLTGAFVVGVMPLPVFLVEYAGRCIGSIWLVIESTRYYALMKKRVAVGVSNPLVADRFKLWAIAGGSALALLATSVPPILFPTSQSAGMLLLIPTFAAGGITASVAYLLAFFPPAWYARWVSGKHGAAGNA